MHDRMPYDPIKGQGLGHGVSEVPNIALFKVYLLCHLPWELANDHRFLTVRLCMGGLTVLGAGTLSISFSGIVSKL